MSITEKLLKGVDRKINIKSYYPLLKEKFKESTLLELIKCFNTYLPCSQCKELLPIDDFTTSTMNKNRLYRHTICRKCTKENYLDLKSKLHVR